MWEKVGCSHVINEGGMGLYDALVDGQAVYPISVAEKGHLWVKVVARGTPGHGSTPRPDEAPARLVAALERLADRRARPDVRPAIHELLRRVGREAGGITGAVLRSGALRGALVRPRLMANPVTRATITNTAHATGFSGALQPNVVPSEVTAIFDCRMLPGVTADALIAELRRIVADPLVDFQVISTLEGNESPWDDPLFDALERNLVDGRDHVVVGPFISIGSTDSQLLRPLGVRAYGIAPFLVDADHLQTMHGDDERIPVTELRDGLRRFFGAVVEFSSAR
jgi:acetylornithine deacetylase/succinyl-diaminopimelate desuccinylase-like protein